MGQGDELLLPSALFIGLHPLPKGPVDRGPHRPKEP